MKPSESWEQAADYVQKHGWARGWDGMHGGPRCANGALRSVVGGVEDYEVALHAMRELGVYAAGWNDNEIQDAKHCVAWLRACAAEMREAGL